MTATYPSSFVLERVSGPAVEPVTLAQMRLHLRAYTDITADDAEIEEIIEAAREWVEDYTGRALVEQSWRLTVGDYVSAYANVDSDKVIGYYRGPFVERSDGGLLLRKSPVIAISSMATVSTEGVETAIVASEYELRERESKWPCVYPLSSSTWSSGKTLRIVYRAGYAPGLGSPDGSPDVTLVPKRYIQAMKLWASAVYDRDEKMMPLQLDIAERLVKSERVELSMA